MNENNAWSKRYTLTVKSKPEPIWQAFVDTDNWKRWNPGVKSITIEGPFRTGTWFTMALPQGEVVRSQLTDVSEGKYFIDETWVDDTLVKVEHRIEASGADQSTVIYAISTQGPQANAFGEGVSADFPEVMEGLAKYLAETGSV
ncbi:SRPBCC family protein [Kosakonia pseudosacchari]|uniref:SRPBCC family protein n=1 Tax=Kosakonia pseudosacchari TaxID=1646340 RepID=UPI0022F07B61|nr:SRPBCC family protein [Kosakonia pseudosacchari]WBU47781.1 SRPBCC family protein [Kosakonia pseudosacchari]